MNHSAFIFRSLCFVLMVCAVSCSPKKSASEQPVSKPADSTASVAPAVKEIPEVKAQEKSIEKPAEKIVEKPTEKKETQPTEAKKNNSEVKPVNPEVKKEVKPVVPVKEPEKKIVEVAPVQEPIKKDTATVKKVVTAPKKDSVAKKVEAVKKVEVAKKGKPYYFKVVRKDDGKEVFGNLQLLEGEGATQYQLIKSGEVVYIEKPKNKRGSYAVSAIIPGYKQSTILFIYSNPPLDKGPNNEDIITLTLDKAKNGDYIDFANVHFFQNSSVLRPVSQTELDELASLMKEEPKYRIKIYGYCNGKQDRDSYLMGASTNFFALDAKTNTKEKISSKELSLARAENVKAYLVSKGIDASRISTKGEGGSVPLYPETGNQAQYNDRVEVEFVK